MLFLFLKKNYCLFRTVYWYAKMPQWLRKKMILNKLFYKLSKIFLFLQNSYKHKMSKKNSAKFSAFKSTNQVRLENALKMH